MDGWTDVRMDTRTDGRRDGWTDGRTDGRMDGCLWMPMDGWMDGWMNGCMDRCVPACNVCMHVCRHRCLHKQTYSPAPAAVTSSTQFEGITTHDFCLLAGLVHDVGGREGTCPLTTRATKLTIVFMILSCLILYYGIVVYTMLDYRNLTSWKTTVHSGHVAGTCA